MRGAISQRAVFSLIFALAVTIFLSLFCLATGCCLRLMRRLQMTVVDPDGRGQYKQV